MLPLPQVTYKTASRYLLSFSFFFISVTFGLIGFMAYRFYPNILLHTVLVGIFGFGLIGFIAGLKGMDFLNKEEQEKREHNAAKLAFLHARINVLLLQIKMSTMDYNEKVNNYNKLAKKENLPTCNLIKPKPSDFLADFIQKTYDDIYGDVNPKN